MPTPLRPVLYALPVATVAVVTLALVTGGYARPVRVARVWGGPTTGERLSVRVEVFDLLQERGAVQEQPVTRGSVSLRLRTPSFDAARTLALDVEGAAEATFEPPASARPCELAVAYAGAELARGKLELDASVWARAARRRGGWAETVAGSWSVRVAPGRGALAVPFAEPVLVAVSGAAAAGLHVHASALGAHVTPVDGVTDASGRLRLLLAPEEHAVTLTLALARDVPAGAAPQSASASFALPVVPGALRATRDGGELVIESPVPRDVAYFALVTPRERLAGGRVALHAEPSGGARARVALPELAGAVEAWSRASSAEPSAATNGLYAVVSSERDLRSSAAVGWPLAAPPEAEPVRSFDAVDALLLDGRPRALLHEARRRARVRWVVGAFSAAALAVELLLLVRFTSRSDRELDRHLAGVGFDAADAERVAPRRSSALIVALIAVAVGFLVIALVGVLRVE